MNYIASFSGGKDSTAMVLRLMEERRPLDHVIFFDTQLEFGAVYSVVDKVRCIVEDAGIQFTTLRNRDSVWMDMLARPTRSGKFGYGWCGGNCRWITRFKQQELARFQKSVGGGRPVHRHCGGRGTPDEGLRQPLSPRRMGHDGVRLSRLLPRSRHLLGGGRRGAVLDIPSGVLLVLSLHRIGRAEEHVPLPAEILGMVEGPPAQDAGISVPAGWKVGIRSGGEIQEGG